MIADNPDRRETDHIASDPLLAIVGLFRTETVPISAFAHLAIAIPGEALRQGRYPRAACPEAGRVGMGCAPGAGQSRLRAIGEAVELASCCAWGDEPILRAPAADLGSQAVDTGAILGFATHQIADRDAWNRRHGRYDWRPSPAGRAPADWIAAKDATTGKTRFIAADAVLIGRREPGDGGAAAIADSNGCAAGATIPAAQAAALLELIERDAAGRWWYGRRTRPALPPSVLAAWPGLSSWIGQRDRRTWLLDITTDIGIPVVAALSCDGAGRVPALGFAARMTLPEAALAAVCELLGIETSLPPWRDVSGDPLLCDWLTHGPGALPPVGEGEIPAPATAPGDPLETCLSALARLGLRAFFIDLTRDVFRVPVVRAFVPGLCHYKPRLGHLRLLAPDPRDLPQIAADRPNPLPLLV